MQGADEALDLLFHVRPRQQAKVVEQLLRAAVELVVEAIDERLAEDPPTGPRAVGAVEVDAPVLALRGLPVDRVDEL